MKVINNVNKALTLAALIFVPGEGNAQNVEIPMAKTDPNVNQQSMDTVLSDTFGGVGVEYYNKGYHYLYGKGVKQSDEQARKWFDLAAKSESPAVRYKIGRLYETGVFYQQDINKAVFHYEFAASKGDSYALNNLAILYLTGQGVDQNIEKGIGFAKQAAKKGNAQAQVNLGLVYLNGTGVGVDKLEALRWFNQAAQQHNTDGLYYVAQYHLSKNEFLEAFEFLNEAANLEHADSQLKLAMLYDKGLGVDKDRAKSLLWLNKAAELGNKKAIKILQSLTK